MKVKDYMRTKYEVVDINEPIDKVIDIISSIPYSEAPVTDGKRIVGEVRQRDLLKLAVEPSDMHTGEMLGALGMREALAGYAKTAKDVMRRHSITVKPNDDIHEIAKLMLSEDVRALPVVDNAKVVGLICELDVLRYVKDKHKGKK